MGRLKRLVSAVRKLWTQRALRYESSEIPPKYYLDMDNGKVTLKDMDKRMKSFV